MNLSRFFVHLVQVATFAGTSGDGDVFASPVSKKCFREDETKLVRSATGEQVVSQTTLYGPLGDLSAYAVNSRVTLPGRLSRVIGVYARDGGTLSLPSHVEVHLE